MPRVPVVVVGAGVSGVACARALAAAGVPVELRERGYAPGGRMASRTLAGRTVDLGASYLTCRTAEFGAVVGSWSERGLARPWTDRFAVRTAAGWGESEPGPVRYGTPGGLRSLVEDLATGLDVQVRREVAEVGPGPRVDGEPVAAVVLAMPDPQASDLLADELTDELRRGRRPGVRAGVRDRGRLGRALLAGPGRRVRRRRRRPDLGRRRRAAPRRRGAGARRAHHGRVRRAAPGPTGGCGRLGAGRAAPGAGDRPAAGAGPTCSAGRWPARSQPHDAPYHLGESMVGLCGDAWGSPRIETAWTSGHLLGRALVERLA